MRPVIARRAAHPRARARRRPAADWQRISRKEWQAIMDDPQIVASYHAKIYKRGHGKCWPWLGAISDAGGAKLRVPRRLGNRVIAAPVLGWQLSRGPLKPGPDGTLPVIRHKCDEAAACMNPSHWTVGSRQDNSQDYQDRRYDPASPFADRRGPAGRARAIRDAILMALADGTDVEQAITRASESGLPHVQDPLF